MPARPGPPASSECRPGRAELQAVPGRLGAGCHTPVAAHARLDGPTLVLTGVVSSPDGATMLRATASAPGVDGERLGVTLADDLLAKGAKAVLDASRG
ncbi:MAG: hypothetical protein ACHQ7H_12840 [Candidatus Rokuibacteriota bacterium]